MNADIFAKYADKNKYIIVKVADFTIEQSPFFTVTAYEITFNDEEWYAQDGKYSMTKNALMRVAGAAGLNLVQSYRTDDGSNMDYASHSVTFTVRMPDGTNRTSGGSKSFDVNARIEADFATATKKSAQNGNEYSGKSEAQIRASVEVQRGKLRTHRAERAESGAIERGIRNILGIKTSYTKEETKKTFVFPVISPRMDVLLLDPIIRQIAMLNAIGATSQIYGQSPDRMLTAIPQVSNVPQVAPQAPEVRALPEGQVMNEKHEHIAASPTVVTSQEERVTTSPTHPSNPEPSPSDVKVDEWKSASPAERQRKIEELLTKKVHGYTTEQMEAIINATPFQQAKKIVAMEAMTDKAKPRGEWKPSEPQIKRLYAIAHANDFDRIAVKEVLQSKYGIEHVEDLSRDRYEHLCDEFFPTESKLEPVETVSTLLDPQPQDDLPF